MHKAAFWRTLISSQPIYVIISRYATGALTHSLDFVVIFWWKINERFNAWFDTFHCFRILHKMTYLFEHEAIGGGLFFHDSDLNNAAGILQSVLSSPYRWEGIFNFD